MNIPICINVTPRKGEDFDRVDFNIITGRNAHDLCSKNPDLVEAIRAGVQSAVRRWLYDHDSQEGL